MSSEQWDLVDSSGCLCGDHAILELLSRYPENGTQQGTLIHTYGDYSLHTAGWGVLNKWLWPGCDFLRTMLLSKLLFYAFPAFSSIPFSLSRQTLFPFETDCCKSDSPFSENPNETKWYHDFWWGLEDYLVHFPHVPEDIIQNGMRDSDNKPDVSS